MKIDNQKKTPRGRPSKEVIMEFIGENIEQSIFTYSSDMKYQTYQDLVWAAKEIKKKLDNKWK